MRRVILESPYAGDVVANIEYARRCMRDSLLRGESPIASHLLYTQPGIKAAKSAFLEAIAAARLAGLEVSIDVHDRAVRIVNGREERTTTIEVDVSKPIQAGR